MTIQDFHRNFDIELDKTLDFEYPYIQPEQKDYWFNKAQDRFIFNILDPKQKGDKGFEETQVNIDAIRTIVVNSPSINTTLNGTIYTSNLPTDYMYKVRHTCNTISPSCGLKTVGGELVTQFQINNLLKDPFWKPSNEYPVYNIIGNTIEYETVDNSFTVVSTKLVYIKTPVEMKLGSQYVIPKGDINCELPKSSHDEILAIAVSMVLENIESQRYQTNLNELNKI